MNDPVQRQAVFNAASHDQWAAFAGHREKVSALLGVGTIPSGGRLCVLGAGNCNDLDLPALLKAHRALHLVDLDPEALTRGVNRQGVADHPSLERSGGIELTGMLDVIASWSPGTTIPPAAIAALAEWPARRVAPILPGPFDIVASTCLLSQLIGNVFPAVGDRHPQFMALVQAIRIGHLRLLAELCAPGGTVVLVTDVVSSDTFPALGSFAGSALPGLLPRLTRERNFINGVNPDVLLSIYRRDPVLAPDVTGLELIAPWIWNLHTRLYLVVAIKYRKRASGFLRS